MMESLTQVPSEHISSLIPVFQTQKGPFIKHRKSESLSVGNPSQKPSSKKSSLDYKRNCKCPHTLISDDDPFQEFYYSTLLQRSVEFDGLFVEKEDFRFKIFQSGEKLLEEYKRIKACGCKTQLLIITDYEMGKTNLTGAETALNLRRIGYEGNIILRTSETREELNKKSLSLDTLLEENVINCFLDKTHHSKTRQTIQDFLKAEKKGSV